MRKPIALALLAAACTAEDRTTLDRRGRGSALSAAAVQVDEGPSLTTAVAFDADGNEIGRLRLTHGVFTLSAPFRDDYDADEVDGRRLEVQVGSDGLVWETAGYDPTLHLPAHPPGHEALAAFLAQPEVSAVLQQWQIGFAPSSAAGANSPYVHDSKAGTRLADCTGLATCGLAIRGKVPSTCGGVAIAFSAVEIAEADPKWPGEDLIAQCCPPLTTTPQNSFSLKACPTLGETSSCGTAKGGGCKACQNYAIGSFVLNSPTNAAGFCHVAFRGALDFCFSETAGPPATVVKQTQVPQLWPPDHSIATIDLESCMQSVSDPCKPALTAADVLAEPTFHIDSAGADEPISADDIQPVGPHAIALRVARSGALAGRTYHVGASFTNEWGVKSSFDCRFGVPHDQGQHDTAEDRWVAPGNPGSVFFFP